MELIARWPFYTPPPETWPIRLAPLFYGALGCLGLRARTEKWPRSPYTPDGVAAQLSRARQMFIDGYYTYKNFIDAATRSLQAVEAALRVCLEASRKISFAQLIDQARRPASGEARWAEVSAPARASA